MLNIFTAWFHNVHVYKNIVLSRTNIFRFITGVKRGGTIIFGAAVTENASGNQ